MTCAAQLQAVEASILVALHHLGQVWLLYLQYQAWLLSKQHRQHWENNGGIRVTSIDMDSEVVSRDYG